MSDHGIGTQIYVTPNPMFQLRRSSFMKFYSFTEPRASQIKAGLMDGYIREAVTVR